MQEGAPLFYASRALSVSEPNYAQLEKELLAVVFAMSKFSKYIYGKTVIVQSDLKPLEAIFTKPLCKAPARLQKMLLQLQRYDLNVKYTPGKDVLIAVAIGQVHKDMEDLYSEK